MNKNVGQRNVLTTIAMVFLWVMITVVVMIVTLAWSLTNLPGTLAALVILVTAIALTALLVWLISSGQPSSTQQESTATATGINEDVLHGLCLAYKASLAGIVRNEESTTKETIAKLTDELTDTVIKAKLGKSMKTDETELIRNLFEKHIDYFKGFNSIIALIAHSSPDERRASYLDRLYEEITPKQKSLLLLYHLHYPEGIVWYGLAPNRFFKGLYLEVRGMAEKDLDRLGKLVSPLGVQVSS